MDARVGQFPSTQDHAKQNGGHWPTFRDKTAVEGRFWPFSASRQRLAGDTEVPGDGFHMSHETRTLLIPVRKGDFLLVDNLQHCE